MYDCPWEVAWSEMDRQEIARTIMQLPRLEEAIINLVEGCCPSTLYMDIAWEPTPVPPTSE